MGSIPIRNTNLHRLMVRSSDSQSGNTGSNPVGDTSIYRLLYVFYSYRLMVRTRPFQGRNTGSSPVRSAKYPYRLTAGHVDFQSIDTSSNLVGDAIECSYRLMVGRQTFNLKIRVRSPLGVPVYILNKKWLHLIFKTDKVCFIKLTHH